MNASPISECEAEQLPLCRSYVSVFFSPISTRVSSAAGTPLAPMLWAIGVLYDGQPDYLGCWPASGPKDSRWLAIADNLKARGIERIRFVIGPDPTEMQAAVTAYFHRGTWHCTALLACPTDHNRQWWGLFRDLPALPETRFDRPYQRGGRNTQRPSTLQKHSERRLSLTSFELAVIRAINSSSQRKGILGHTSIESPRPEDGSANARNDRIKRVGASCRARPRRVGIEFCWGHP